MLERHNEAPKIKKLSVRAPQAGEVRIRMQAAGLCHTDISAVRDARAVPIVLGHEGTGVVESVGESVTDLGVGDPVLLCWKTPCSRCRACRAGRLDFCEQPLDTSSPSVHEDDRPLARLLNTGCFCDLVVLPVESVIALDSSLPLKACALIGCAVATGVGAALNTAGLRPGDTAAIWGCGGVGLNVVFGANRAGASLIMAVDPDADRRAFALEWGATHAAHPDDAPLLIERVTLGRGVDAAFEVVGAPAVMESALSVLGRGGKLILVGAAARDAIMSYRPREFMSKQQQIVGCIYGNVKPHTDLPLYVEWVRSGLLPVERLIGSTVSLDDLPVAFGGTKNAGIRTVVSFR